MNIITPDFLPALPEIFLLSAICIILLIDVYMDESHRAVTYRLSQLSLLVTAALTWYGYDGGTRITFDGSFIADPMADVLKMFVYLTVFGVFVYSKDYLRERGLFKGEFYVIGLLGVLGMMVMISAHSLLTVYLGLELLSLSLYSMIALHRDDGRASEAAMKYFVLGALASGMLLYGMSMLYGVAGSLDIATIASAVAQPPEDMKLVLSFGLVFIVVGVAFKLGAVPFHMWVPDIYEGAPTVMTMYVGSAPKIAAFAMTMRLLAEATGSLSVEWSDMFFVLAVLSLIIGNVVAIAQTSLKRMLAYSTISHIGFIAMGILVANNEGYAAAMFYTLTYAVTAMGGFAILVILSRNGVECESLDDIKGLNQRSPWLALMMLLLIFSMAGVPPMVGFYAKLAILQAVIQADMIGLAITAVVFSIVGAFYYLRIIKLMYFDDAAEDAPELKPAFDTNLAISSNGLAILALGLYPSALMALCVTAIAGSL